MKRTIKFLKIIAIALTIIIAIMFIKFRPAYSVSLNGEMIGYVGDEKEFKEKINENVLDSEEENVAFVKLDNVEYNFELVNRNEVNDDKVLVALEDNATNVYRVYEVADLNNENDKVYVNTMEEAEDLVASLKENYNEIEPDLVINTIYLDDVSEVNDENIKLAKEKMTANLQEELEEKQEKESRTVNGIYLAYTPVTGRITSRFGARESIRNHTHKGIDIGAAGGTTIVATAGGTVTYAGWNSGGYGNLVKIDHGNGVETYYGHCSKVYVKKGQQVEAGEKIAAVGSTGRSTGNHLHFEIRLNGAQVNPQKYVYK